MELQQLRYFRAVAQEQSFTRAAKRLYVTQPNVSVQIRKLEHELGTVLFDRARGAVTLSPAGELLNECVESILSTLDETTTRIRALDEPPPACLRVGYLPSTGGAVVPALVVSVKEAVPDLALAFEEIADSRRIHAMLEDGELDVGIARAPEQGAPRHARVLFTEEFVVACPRRGSLRGAADLETLQALAEAPFVIPSAGIGLREQIVGICRSLGFEPRVALEAQSLDLLLGAVARGVGVSVLPRLCLDRTSGIVRVGLPSPPATRTIALSWRPQAETFRRHPRLLACLRRYEVAPRQPGGLRRGAPATAPPAPIP